MYIKICKNCDKIHELDGCPDVCSCGESLITVAPEVIEEKPRYYKECGVCSTRNYVVDGREPRVCKHCGSDNLFRYPLKLEEATKNEIGYNNLILISRDGNEVKLTIIDGTVIGRLGDVNPKFFFDYPKVGRRHCEFKFKHGKWYVRNVNAVNGTLINGTLINVNRGEESFFNELKQGDVISIANAHFEVSLEVRSD